MPLTTEAKKAIEAAVNVDRLVATARTLIDVPSPTTRAGKVADRLAGILASDGFEVQRVTADWPEAPAVVTRLSMLLQSVWVGLGTPLELQGPEYDTEACVAVTIDGTG